MISSFARPLCAVAALLAAVHPLLADRWQKQYFYDQEKSVLHIVDLQFPSATRGVAVGVITEGQKEKSVAIVTSDGGRTWTTVDLPEPPISLFFLNEGIGWLTTSKGNIYETTEAGRNWKRLAHLPAPAYHVAFIDDKNGFAACGKKKVLQTTDGGVNWSPVAAGAEQPGDPDHSLYNWVGFATPKDGFISGWNMPPRRNYQRVPDVIDPEEMLSRRDLPHLSYSLSTHDAGKTWKSSSASLFGQVTKIRFGPGGLGLGLMEHSPAFRYPSEVYKFDWHTAKSQTVFRERKFSISDIWLTPGGVAYLAGTAVTGQLRSVIPGKVQVLTSKDMTSWSEMEVYYAASATRVFLAAAGENDLWMATDQGMILKLTK